MSAVQHILITGGSRSGKSRFAETMARQLGGEVLYLATAEALDEEMAERIASHRRRRPAQWRTLEVPLDPVEAIREAVPGQTLLLDCLTLFLSNLLFQKYPAGGVADQAGAVQAEIESLAAAIAASPAHIIVVTNEVGWGIVPENALARFYRDLAGSANQTIAAVCDQVYLVISGIPVLIKENRHD
jgi:adenosylcobinamide kinase/adenosylcobinamide-phosphate guanylyltransferase